MSVHPKRLSRFSIWTMAVALAAAVGSNAVAGGGDSSDPAKPVAPATKPAVRPAFQHAAADVINRFHAALLRGDTDAATKATSDTAKPLTDLPRRIERLVKRLKDDPTPLVVHDIQFEGDVAVALIGQPATIGDKAFDADVWFLVRQAGEWRVLPDYHAYNRPEYGFDANRLEAYRKLEEKAEKRILELKLEITGCAC